MRVRSATPGDVPAVRNVLDGALLEIEMARLERAVDRNDALVAVRDSQSSDDQVLGALVLEDATILAVAVRKRRRDQGIGTTLVAEAAARETGHLSAEFHRRVRPFWESLGFAIEETDEDERFRGHLPR